MKTASIIFDAIGAIALTMMGPCFVAFGLWSMSRLQASDSAQSIAKTIGYFTLFGVATTFSLYKQLVINDNSRREREKANTELAQANAIAAQRQSAYDESLRRFRAIAPSTHSYQTWLAVAKTLRKRHPNSMWTIIDAYQEVEQSRTHEHMESAPIFVMRLLGHDEHKGWPTVEWASARYL